MAAAKQDKSTGPARVHVRYGMVRAAIKTLAENQGKVDPTYRDSMERHKILVGRGRDQVGGRGRGSVAKRCRVMKI